MVAIYEDAGERSKYNIKQSAHWKHLNVWKNKRHTRKSDKEKNWLS